MRAGWLRHRLVIQSKSYTPNAYGEPVETWTTTATVWGSVEPLRGTDYLTGRTIAEVVTTKIRIRYRSGIAPEMRVTWDGHTYDIESVVEVKTQKRELELMCSEAI